MMTEAQLERYLKDELREINGLWFQKNHGHALTRRGIPDLTIVIRGVPILAELKKEDELLDKLQMMELERFNKYCLGLALAIGGHYNVTAFISALVSLSESDARITFLNAQGYLIRKFDEAAFEEYNGVFYAGARPNSRS